MLIPPDIAKKADTAAFQIKDMKETVARTALLCTLLLGERSRCIVVATKYLELGAARVSEEIWHGTTPEPEVKAALRQIIEAHDSYVEHNPRAINNPDWLDEVINAARPLVAS